MFESTWFWWVVFGLVLFFVFFGRQILSLWPKKNRNNHGTSEEAEETAGKTPLRVWFIAAILTVVAFFLYEYQLAHVGDLVKTSPKSGYFYFPVHGLLFAVAAVAITTLLGEIPSVGFLFTVAFYVFLPIGVYNGWFLPHVGDPIVHTELIAFGAAGIGILVFFRMGPEDWRMQQGLMGYIPFALVAVFAPQLFL